MITGFYPGSFDPPTLGHIDIIKRACSMFPKLVVGIGDNKIKKTLINKKQRLEFLLEICEDLKDDVSSNISVILYEGLTVEAAAENNACAIIRGIRDSIDYTYEARMGFTNKFLKKNIETVFLMASPNVQHISSLLVKEVAELKGNLKELVPNCVASHIKNMSIN